ncbi:YhgN family NAAT transporter [Buchnera aphidicola]|uniref:YhgN family NAAT transporter n=1 Tax=Buchnera aphidicola TaxID=9 RepID=UPI0030EE4745
MKEMLSITILLILIMDPLGNLPIFMSILKNFKEKKRRIILVREMSIALALMIFFLFFGETLLKFLNLDKTTISISGGIILFAISLKMIFPENGPIEKKISPDEEPFLVPLAIPLIAGPSLLATLMLLSHKYMHKIQYLLIALLIAWTITLLILLSSNFFLNLFGKRGVNALERLMGLILIMLSTQMFLDGLKSWVNS